jgi:hypothetical protein
MANGKLILFRKDNFSSFALLDIIGSFNIEDNLNETPSNMKVKAITSNSFREEFEVNTVALHEDTNTWWVIKSDESTYLHTGEYEHEIQLIELLEFYSYRHLPNCAFAPNTYTLLQMLNRLFSIGKLTSPTLTVPNPLPSFLDQNKIMPFLSFENFTVANAIKNIARAINAIPKVTATYSTSGGVFYLIGSFVLTFINRNGIDNTIVETLNTQFPIAYEKNMNSSDQFTTRSVSNITNAKSSSLIITPKSGGFKNIVENATIYDSSNRDSSRVYLPSKIDRVEFVRLYPSIIISRFIVGGSSTTLFEGYYLDKEEAKNAIVSKVANFSLFTLSDLQALVMPEPNDLHQINLNDTLGGSFPNTFFKGLHTLKSKFDFDTSDKLTGDYDTIEKVKDKTIHWLPFSNELVLGKSIRLGLEIPTLGASQFRFVNIAQKISGSTIEVITIFPKLSNVGFFSNRTPVNELLVQVGYYPIADIKVSIDNDNDAQDEKFFNQSGKIIDAVSVSKLITSHTNDSVEGTKIRNARYESLANVLPLGQLVRDSNQTYVITQRSIDGQVKNGNEYYNIIYTLSRNRVARSENIVADSAVISYKTPDDNLVFRTQLYKDYIELSLANITPKDTPYLSMSKALVLSDTLAGTNFDYTILAKNNFSSITSRYIKNPTTFDLHKAKLINVDWQSNNLLGYRLDSTGATYVQTPILYTDNLGKATNFELLFLDTNNLIQAKNSFNLTFPSKANNLIPFEDLTRVDNDFYNTSVLANGRFSIRINEVNYSKDPFEIPVFEYMIQGNDDYNNLGNIVIGNDLFTTLTGDIRYHYLINNTTRFTAENAERLFLANVPSSLTDRRVLFGRPNPTQITMALYSTFAPNASPFPVATLNTSDVTNVGVYALKSPFGEVKFLFAINDYKMTSKSNFNIFINNWKI